MILLNYFIFHFSIGFPWLLKKKLKIKKSSKYNFCLFDLEISGLRNNQLSKSFCSQQRQYFWIGWLPKHKNKGLENKKKKNRIWRNMTDSSITCISIPSYYYVQISKNVSMEDNVVSKSTPVSLTLLLFTSYGS